jgi:hypothetical protein
MGRARKFTGTTSGTVEDEGITAIEELRPSVHVSFLTSTTTICSADHYSSESLFTNVTLNPSYIKNPLVSKGERHDLLRPEDWSNAKGSQDIIA